MNSIMFKKTILAVLVAALIVAVLPVSSVFAAGEDDPPTPPEKGEVSNERLAKVWARQLRTYERLGRAFDQTDTMLEKIQDRIDKARENGKDVSAIQAALDAFEAAIQNTRPLYESANGIVSAHQGFDEVGNVTDTAQAKETVSEMGAQLKEIKSAMGGTGRALREAIKAFREANKPAGAPPERDS